MRIERLYDSHAHFLASSIFDEALKLEKLNSLDQINFDSNSEIIYGFGWTPAILRRLNLTLDSLDQVSKSKKVVFSRSDGHAIFVNTAVINFLSLDVQFLKIKFGSSVDLFGLDKGGRLNGIFYEQVAFWIWNELLSKRRDFLKNQLLKSQDLWLKKGFTHVRDMSGNRTQWEALCDLERSQRLKIYLIQNFEFRHGDDIKVTLNQALLAKQQESEHLRVGGIKIFLDGTIGSQTAAISHAYLGCAHAGHLLLKDEEVYEFTKVIWLSHLPICFHVIGDLGVVQAIKAAKRLRDEGIRGEMHMEHLEICSKELIQEMVDLSVVVHFQPAHFLSDKDLLGEHVPGPLRDWAFPWYEVEKNQIPYFFGFDSPISPIGLKLTRAGLLEAEKFGIKMIRSDWSRAHSYPDPSFGKDCVTKWALNDSEFEYPRVCL